MPTPNDQNDFIWDLEFRPLKFIWYLACLREAATAKAGAWLLVLIHYS
jgi:hypothetical protein